MKINPPNASYIAVQDALQQVFEKSSNRDRRTLALASALLMKLCYDARVSPIADDPRVIAAVDALLEAVMRHLEVRIEAEKAGFLSSLFSIRPAFNRTSEAVDSAKNTLNATIQAAWIEAEGRDPRDDDSYHDQFCALTGMAA